MKYSIMILSALIIISFYGFSLLDSRQDEPVEDHTHCVIKHKSEWGTKCMDCGELHGYKVSFDETYKVKLGNSCDYPIDVKCCVQESDKTWKCFHFENMTKKDTMTAWACKGTGKYLKWAKKAGDTELVFPTNEEVHEMYKE